MAISGYVSFAGLRWAAVFPTHAILFPDSRLFFPDSRRPSSRLTPAFFLTRLSFLPTRAAFVRLTRPTHAVAVEDSYRMLPVDRVYGARAQRNFHMP